MLSWRPVPFVSVPAAIARRYVMPRVFCGPFQNRIEAAFVNQRVFDLVYIQESASLASSAVHPSFTIPAERASAIRLSSTSVWFQNQR